MWKAKSESAKLVLALEFHMSETQRPSRFGLSENGVPFTVPKVAIFICGFGGVPYSNTHTHMCVNFTRNLWVNGRPRLRTLTMTSGKSLTCEQSRACVAKFQPLCATMAVADMIRPICHLFVVVIHGPYVQHWVDVFSVWTAFLIKPHMAHHLKLRSPVQWKIRGFIVIFRLNIAMNHAI